MNLTKRTFPNSTGRQNRINHVKITKIGFKIEADGSLVALANCRGEDGQYQPVVRFLEVEEDSSGIKLGKYKVHPISVDTDVQVRCTCEDFNHTFAWYNLKDGSLYGPKPAKYKRVPGSTRPPRNPEKTPGLCKHLMALFAQMYNKGIIE